MIRIVSSSPQFNFNFTRKKKKKKKSGRFTLNKYKRTSESTYSKIFQIQQENKVTSISNYFDTSDSLYATRVNVETRTKCFKWSKITGLEYQTDFNYFNTELNSYRIQALLVWSERAFRKRQRGATMREREREREQFTYSIVARRIQSQDSQQTFYQLRIYLSRSGVTMYDKYIQAGI